MTLRNYIDIILIRKWVVLTTVIITLAVVAAGTWYMRPTYTATATLRIATASVSSSYSDYQYADRLINTYISIATSQPLLDQLAKQLNFAQKLNITVEAVPNTELITISVDDHDPNLAFNAANALGNILVNQSNDLYAGSGKSPSQVLKAQVDQAENDLNQARVYYYQLMSSNPDDNAGITAAGQEMEVKQQIYNSLLSQYSNTQTEEAMRASLVSVINPAALPILPSRPNKPLFLALGLFIGLAAGFGLVFLFENLDSSLTSVEQIVSLSKLRAVGRIPFAPKKKIRQVPLDGDSFYAEAFLRLRTNFLSLINDPPFKALMITSADQGEGKSTIISNLAYSLAQVGKKVILIDCDFRLPTLHKLLFMPNKQGLSEYLIDGADLEDIIQPTNYDGLSIITRGRPVNEPGNLLGSDQMKALLLTLKLQYDVVLLDSPSVLAVSDTSVLAPLVDGVILVVRKSGIKRERLINTLEHLAYVKAGVLGLIINGEKISENYYSYRRYAPIKRG